MTLTTTQLSFDDFLNVDMRVGTIIAAKINQKARKAAYIVTVDFGSLGIKTSSAQITENYQIDDLLNTQVIAVVNFPVKLIAGVKSEVLILAAVSEEKGVVLLRPSLSVPNGSRIS